MKITLIPSAVAAAQTECQYLTSYLVNDTIAIDAGSIGFWKGPTEQSAIRHLFISHSHLDHVASLPIFLDNVTAAHPTPVDLYASEVVQDSLRRDLFNGRVWANFLDMTHERGRFVNVHTIASGQSVEVAGVRVTCVAVDHTVPNLGFILEDDHSAVVIAGDTGPTHAIWNRAQKAPNLKAVFLEATFPDEMGNLADLTKHLTPAGFLAEMWKLARPVRFLAVHLRARCRELVARQLQALRLPNVEIAQPGKTYEF